MQEERIIKDVEFHDDKFFVIYKKLPIIDVN